MEGTYSIASKDDQVDQGPSYIKSLERKIYVHEIYLDQDISEPENYREMISLLFNSGPDDRFHIYINSCGGYVSSGGAIIEGLKNTNGTTCAILAGDTHSAASMITMYCDEVLVLDSACMMVHTASFGSGGFVGNVKSHADFEFKRAEKLVKESYSGFLTDQEMLKVLDGVEMWFDADDIRQRIENRKVWIEQQTAEIQKKEELAEKEVATRSKRKSKLQADE